MGCSSRGFIPTSSTLTIRSLYPFLAKEIGHFQVILCLCFETSLLENVFDLHENGPAGGTHFDLNQAPSTRIGIFLNPQLFLSNSGFKNFPVHTKRIYPDSLQNPRDTCGRKPYPERKSRGFKVIRVLVDGASISHEDTF